MGCHVREGNGLPTSKNCFMKSKTYWVDHFGFPEVVTCDRGLNHRGYFRKALLAEGCYIRNTALEAPEQLGRCERHGDILKKLYKAVSRAHRVVGKQKAKECMMRCYNTKNSGMRKGGIARHRGFLDSALKYQIQYLKC